MEILFFIVIFTALFLLSLYIQYKEKRSAQSWMSERLLYLRVRQSLIPIEKDARVRLQALSMLNEKRYQLPVGLKWLYKVEERTYEGMQCFWLGNPDSKQIVYYLHGGSYVEQPMLAHWLFLENLAHQGRCKILAPLYPLAPNHQVRESMAKVRGLYEYLVETYADCSITLMGDSAGGGLALSLAQLGIKQPKAIALLSPWLDIGLSNPLIDHVQKKDPMLDKQYLLTMGAAWAGSVSPSDPLVSPLRGPLQGLAPLHLFVGTHEIFLPDARTFQRRCKEEGVRLSYHEGKRLNHDYPLFPIPEGRQTLSILAKIVREVNT